jgi:outer membrane protein assembly factor BamB
MPGPDLGRSWGMVRRLVVCAILLIPAVAHATTPARGAIHYYSALAGRFAFVQPDGSLTVLDSSTGKVLFHGEGRLDERYSWNSFFETPHGLVVRSYRWKLIGRDESVYRMVDLARQAVVWEIASRADCHVGEDYLVCPDWRDRLVAHRLADGKELWTYRPESATGEVLDSKGRVMVSAHDEARAWRESADGSRTLSSRDRVRSVAVLDGPTGRELLAARGLEIDVAPVSYGTSAFSFDGAHVEVDVLSASGACAGRLRRTLTVNAASDGFTSEDKCVPAEPAHESSPAFERIARSLPPVQSALRESEGRVFVDRGPFASGLGRLDALDAGSGRLLWSYSFPMPRDPRFF